MGTAGFSYGVEGIWQFNTLDELFGRSPTGATWGNVPWQTAMHYKGSEQLGLGANFMRKLHWWKLTPAPDRVSYHAGIENYYDPYCATLGDDILVYFTKVGFKKNQLKVLGLVPGEDYSMTYFDPITGMEYPPEKITANEKGEWLIGTPPVMQDWILHIGR